MLFRCTAYELLIHSADIEYLIHLNSQVEQERLGTAEDSNYQFIKLAGKVMPSRGQNL